MPTPPEPAKGSTTDDPDEEVVKDPDLVAFGAGVRELREAAAMTQEGLAAAADLHWTYIGQIERGERNLTYKNILKLARGLDVEPAALMPEADQKP